MNDAALQFHRGVFFGPKNEFMNSTIKSRMVNKIWRERLDEYSNPIYGRVVQTVQIA